MLAYAKGTQTIALDFDAYYIQQEWNGWEDSLHFSLPAGHPQRADLYERLRLTDQESGQTYAITAIDEGKTTADVTAVLDLDELQTTMLLNWTNGSNTIANTITSVLPTGWRVTDSSQMTIRRTIPEDAQTPFNGTPLDVIEQCVSTFDGVAIRFDNAARVVQLFCPANNTESGAYYTDELNLTERPQFKGKADGDYYTRLFPFGKDGLSISGVNGGVNYVDCHDYDDRIICRYWKDERYTVAADLLAAAKTMVAKAAVPARSYTCSVVDLARIDPERYAYQGAEMYQVVTLIDRQRGTRTAHKVVQYRYYPHYPAKNVITLSTVPGKITGKAQAAYEAVVNPTGSKIGAEIRAAQDHLQKLITGATGGHIVINFGDDGQTAELLCMDTADKATCKSCIRLNKAGMGFSQNGYNGPFNTAIGIDGGLFSQWIATWQLTADIIKAGILQSVDGKTFYLDLENGILKMAANELTIAGKSLGQAALDAQSQTDIFNKLTNNGAAQGMYMVDGQLYLNATYLATGILQSRDGISFWLNLETGELYMNGKGRMRLLSNDTRGIVDINQANIVLSRIQLDTYQERIAMIQTALMTAIKLNKDDGSEAIRMHWDDASKISEIIFFSAAGIQSHGNQELLLRASPESGYVLKLGVQDGMWSLAPTTSGALSLGTATHKWGQLYTGYVSAGSVETESMSATKLSTQSINGERAGWINVDIDGTEYKIMGYKV